jgi:dTMP kinase
MVGKFFVLEGIDGAGKSLATLKLTEYLNSNGHPSIHTYEPYSNFITQTIYDILYKRIPEPEPRVMATLFTASRMQHIEHIIKPALADGINVVSDRYIFSTFAYNSDMMTRDLIEEDHKEFYYPPDHIFFLACSPEIAVERSESKRQKSIFDEDRERLTSIADVYKSMFLEEAYTPVNTIYVCGKPSTVHLIDANQTRAHVMKQIYHVVDTLIHKPIDTYTTPKKHD